MARYIVRDSEGHIEKVFDRKKHEYRKSEGCGYGCLVILTVAIVAIAVLSSKKFLSGEETESQPESLQIEIIKKEEIRHRKKAKTTQQDIVVAEGDSDVVEDIVMPVVDDVVDAVVTSDVSELPENSTMMVE
jgi:hypothetical protein